MPSAIDFVADEEAQSPPAKAIDFQPDQPSRERQFRESAGVAGYPLPASGEERAARDIALTQRAGLPLGGGEHLPEEVTSPVAAINTAMRYVGKGATEVLNAPARLSNLISGAKPGEKPYIPTLESEKPLIQLPQITPEQMRGESKPTQVAAGVYNKLAEFGSGISAPGTILPAVALPGGIAKVAFGGQIAANIPGTIQESAKTLRDPKATLMEKGGAVIAPPAEAWMLRQIIKAAPTLPNAAKAAAESIGVETLKKGEPYAIPVRSAKTLPVGETPGGSPEVGQRVPQPEAPAQTQAPQEAQQPTLRLTDEDQAHIDAERATVDVPVEVRAPTADEPFAQAKAGQIASIDRQRGTIVINPAEFSGWLNEDMKGLSPERKRLAVRSLLAEERNHLATSADNAAGYWNSLSVPERAIEQKLYTTSFRGKPDISPTDLGFEAIRRRMQRLARMDSTETAAAAGAERWGLKSLEVLNDAIRTIRETVGTKASKEGLAILAKVRANLDTARIVAGGGNPASLRQAKPEDRDSVARATILAQEQQAKEMREAGHGEIAEGIENNVSALKQQYPRWQEQNFPAALRRKRTTEDERQQGFLLPETKGKGVLSKPPTQPATEGAPELRGKPVTASELEADAVRHLSQTARPSFADFAAGAKAKYGPELQSGQLRELWQESVWKRLTSATGSELGRLRDQLGLGREFGDRTVADAPAETKGFQLEGEATKQAKALDAAGRERQLAEQRYRNNVAARIGEKLIAEAETGRKAWRRKEVTPDEVATWRETSEGAFRPVSKDETNDPAALGRTLTEGAATERSTLRRAARGGRTIEVRSKAPPESVTKRLTAFVNRATGKVELVSTYRSGRAGAMVVDPAKLGSMRPNVPLATALTRYHPIYSVLLDEPVQNFHQSFESVRDFEERFGAEARQRVQEANQSAEPPPAATEPEPEKGATLTLEKPLQDNEAGAVLSKIISEVGKFESPDDVRLTIAGFADEARTMPITKLDWPAINGFAKIYDALKRKWPLLDDEQVMAQMSEEIYAIHAQPETTFDDFVARVTQAYQREGGRISQPRPERPTQGAATEVSPTSKELTMPIERRPPTDVRPENVPRGVLPEKRPAPPVPEGTPGEIEPPQMLSPEDLTAVKREAEIKAAQRENNPAALRRITRPAEDEFLNIANQAAATMSRWGAKQQISRLADGATDGASLIAERSKRWIQNPSDEPGKLQMLKTRHGKPAVLQAARAVNASYQPVGPPSPTGAPATWAPNRALLAGFMQRLDAGEAKARQLIASPTPATLAAVGLDQISGVSSRQIAKIGRDWVTGIERVRPEVEYANAHWRDPELRQTTERVREAFGEQLYREHQAGIDTREVPNYMPGLYEGEIWDDNGVHFGGTPALGRMFGKPKSFPDVYTALENGPFIPKSMSVADSAYNRIRSGMTRIAERQAFNAAKGINDPTTNTPIAIDPVRGRDGEWQVPPGEEQRTLVRMYGQGKPLAVRKGYANTIQNLFSQSAVPNWVGGKAALAVNGLIKHAGILLYDTFHPGRLGDYALSILGKEVGFNAAYNALEYTPKGLREAVSKGLVPQSAADWALGREEVSIGGKRVMVTRQRLLEMGVRRGLNANRISDALFKHMADKVPGAGWYNRMLFDKFQRGLMGKVFVEEFTRLNKAAPGMDAHAVMDRVISDTNTFFGSLGRQSIIKNPTARDLSQIFLLAPQWLMGLVGKEASFLKRSVTAPYKLLTEGRAAANVEFGTIGKGIGRGLLAMFLLTQAINLATRRKLTFQNEEEGHKLDAWLPSFDGAPGHWISPLSIFMEITHDLIRLVGTKPTAMEAVRQIGENKLGPMGRFAVVLGTGKGPTGEKSTTSLGTLETAGAQLAPVPISLGRFGQAAGHAVAPGLVPPTPPGAIQRQIYSSFGVKSEIADTATKRVSRMAQRFIEQNGLKKTGFDFQPTDEPDYAKVRMALARGDKAGAAKLLKQLGKPDEHVIKVMKNWSKRPFTGSQKAERAFIAGLTDAELEVYSQAQEERQQLLEKFYDLILSN